MYARFSVKCPYCGFVNSIAEEVCDLNLRKIVYCSSEDGGCDKPIALGVNVKFEVRISKINWVKQGEDQ